MKPYSLSFVIVVSLLLSLLGSSLFVVMGTFLELGMAFKLCWFVIGLTYLSVFLEAPLLAARLRILDLALIGGLSFALFFSSTLEFVVGLACAMWVARAVRKSGWQLRCADLAVSVMAVAAALLAWQESGGFFWVLWVFLLTQSLVFLLTAFEKVAVKESVSGLDMNFARACRQAEAALTRLSTGCG